MPKTLTEKMAKTLLSALECSSSELSILFTTDEEIQQLNSQYRGKDAATDVLSFPLVDKDDPVAEDLMLGDVVISLETAERQALELEVTFQEEVLRLLVHGLLHLLGYDHENVSESEVKRMQDKEDELYELCLPLLAT